MSRSGPRPARRPISWCYRPGHCREAQRGGDGVGDSRHRRAAGPITGPGGRQQRADRAFRIGAQRAVHRDTLRSECVQRRLLALDLLLGGGFGRDPNAIGESRISLATLSGRDAA